MAHRKLLVATVLILCAPVLAAADRPPFEDLRRTPVAAAGDAGTGAAKAAVCQACHGPEGRSLAPVFPSLAGQSASYLVLQLKAYQSGARANPVMGPLAQPLSEADMLDLAAYFAAQPARSVAAAAEPELLRRGERLYQAGEPAAGIPPCQGCHGVDGRGPPSPGAATRTPWHSFPALAGQPAAYVAAQLQAFKDGSRSASSNALVMHGVVGNMDAAAMKALGAYAQSLPVAP